MFSRDELEAFLKDLDLPINEANIKWAFEMMIKQIKLDIKLKKFEKKYGQSVFEMDLDDNCCGGGCCCDDDDDAKKDSKKKK